MIVFLLCCSMDYVRGKVLGEIIQGLSPRTSVLCEWKFLERANES